MTITLTVEEHRIVSVARALVDLPAGPVVTLLKRGHSPPLYLTTDARYLIEETLAIGWVEVLARQGGWRRRPGPGGAVGRVWHRHDPVEMSFTRFAPQLCAWLARSDLWFSEHERLAARPETAGDHLLCLMATRLILGAGCDHAVVSLAGSWLVQLVYPELVARRAPAAEPADPPMDDPCSRLIADGLGDLIAARIVEVEAARARVVDLELARRIAAIQSPILERVYAGLERAGAVEIGRFALDAAGAILEAPPDYGAALGPGSVAERAAARTACGGFLRSLDWWRRRADAARSVRFFDDDYDRSQRVLTLWETVGDRGHARLAAIAGELDALS